ncbi:hypothetical protein V8E54_015131 [Elaphomyces granulatus]
MHNLKAVLDVSIGCRIMPMENTERARQWRIWHSIPPTLAGSHRMPFSFISIVMTALIPTIDGNNPHLPLQAVHKAQGITFPCAGNGDFAPDVVAISRVKSPTIVREESDTVRARRGILNGELNNAYLIS